jgi:hypothetical protein
MGRFLRYSLLAIFMIALSSPAFAIFCRSCGDDSVCFHNPDSGTRCVQHIDFCQEFGAACTGVAGRDTLADSLEVASVDVVTPAGVKTTTTAAPRLAARRPAVTAVAPSFTR